MFCRVWPAFQWPIRSTAIHVPDHTHKSMICCRPSRSRKRLLKCRDSTRSTFLHTNLHEPFFKQSSYYVGFNVNKSFFFWQPNIHVVLNVQFMLRDSLFSWSITRQSSFIILRTASMYSGKTIDFEWSSQNSSLNEQRPRLNSANQRNAVTWCDAKITKSRSRLIDTTLLSN